MSLTQLINRECILLQRGPDDDTDDFDPADHRPEDTAVSTVCEIQQPPTRSQNERGDQGEVADNLWNVYFRAGEDITTADAVVIDGQVYEFVGDPWEARNPRTGVLTHIEAVARRTAGSEDAS